MGLIFRGEEIRQSLDSSPGSTRFILAQPPTSLVQYAENTRFRLRVIPNLASERRVPPASPAHCKLPDAGWASPQLPIIHPRRSAYLELLKATGHALAAINDRHLDSVRWFSPASLSQTDALAIQVVEWPPGIRPPPFNPLRPLTMSLFSSLPLSLSSSSLTPTTRQTRRKTACDRQDGQSRNPMFAHATPAAAVRVTDLPRGVGRCNLRSKARRVGTLEWCWRIQQVH